MVGWASLTLLTASYLLAATNVTQAIPQPYETKRASTMHGVATARQEQDLPYLAWRALLRTISVSRAVLTQSARG
jgi:hypothetical protein